MAVGFVLALSCALNGAPVSVAYSLNGDTTSGGELKEADFIYRSFKLELSVDVAVITSAASGAEIRTSVPLQRSGKRAMLTVDQEAIGLRHNEPITLWSKDITVPAPVFYLSAPIFDGKLGTTMSGFNYRVGVIANGFAIYTCDAEKRQ